MNKIPPDLVWLFVALVAGIARISRDYLAEARRFTPRVIAAELIVGLFTGWLVGHGVSLIEPEWAIFGSAVGAYSGFKLLDFIAFKFKQRVDKEI